MSNVAFLARPLRQKTEFTPSQIRLSPPMGILFFHPSRRRAVFPSPRLFLSPIICGRRQRKPACTSRKGRGLDFTTCVTA